MHSRMVRMLATNRESWDDVCEFETARSEKSECVRERQFGTLSFHMSTPKASPLKAQWPKQAESPSLPLKG